MAVALRRYSGLIAGAGFLFLWGVAAGVLARSGTPLATSKLPYPHAVVALLRSVFSSEMREAA